MEYTLTKDSCQTLSNRSVNIKGVYLRKTDTRSQSRKIQIMCTQVTLGVENCTRDRSLTVNGF